MSGQVVRRVEPQFEAPDCEGLNLPHHPIPAAGTSPTHNIKTGHRCQHPRIVHVRVRFGPATGGHPVRRREAETGHSAKPRSRNAVAEGGACGKSRVAGLRRITSALHDSGTCQREGAQDLVRRMMDYSSLASGRNSRRPSETAREVMPAGHRAASPQQPLGEPTRTPPDFASPANLYQPHVARGSRPLRCIVAATSALFRNHRSERRDDEFLLVLVTPDIMQTEIAQT